MKKKIFSLLTLLLAVCSGAWADTETYSRVFTSSDASTIKSDKTKTWTDDGGDTWTVDKTGDGTASTYVKYNKQDIVVTITGHGIAGTLTQMVITNYCNSSPTTEALTVYKSDGTTETQIGSVLCSKKTNSAGSSTISFTSPKPTIATTDRIIIKTSNVESKSNAFYLGGATITYETVSSKVATPTVALGDWDAEKSKYAVTLDCLTEGATIKYSTDNKVKYSDYSTALALAPGTTLDAYAVKTGLDNSDDMVQYTVPVAPCTITYAIGEGSGVVPAAVSNITPGTEITLPVNRSMYKDDCTLTGWSDGTTTYATGASYTVTADATLKAVYTSNSGVTLASRNAAVTVKWGPWNQDNGVPVIDINGDEGFVVTQATVNGTTIDVKLDIDATASGAKFVNQATNTWTQVNPGIKFTIPAASDATITYKQYDDGSTTTPEVTATGNTYELTLGGTSGQLYLEYIQVVLPAPTFAITYATGLANGSISGDATATAGETVTVTATPDSGYEFDALTIKTSDNTDVTAECSVDGNTFVMPAYDVTVSATFSAVIVRDDFVMSFSNTCTPDVYFNITNTNASNAIGGSGSSGYGNLNWTSASSGYSYALGTTMSANNGTSVLVTKSSYTKISAIELEVARNDNGMTLAIDVSPNADFSSSVTSVRTAAAYGSSNRQFAKVTISNLDLSGYIRISFKSNSKIAAITYLKVTAASATESITTALTAGDRNYVSYVTSQKMDFAGTDGITAYIATGLNGAGNAVVLSSVDVVPAGTPIIVKTDTKGDTKSVSLTNETASSTTGNLLIAGDGTTGYDGYSGYEIYYLASDLFHKANDGTLQSGKAYLKVASEGAARELGFVFGDDETTGIDEVQGSKFNVQGDFYDLQGRRVAQPTKGLYIVGGKKIVLK